MESIFGWQMVGDTIKIASWILAYVATAKAFIFLLVVSEIVVNVLLALLVVLFVENFGLSGTGMAHTATYTVYLLIMFLSLKYKKYIQSPLLIKKDSCWTNQEVYESFT